MDALEAFLSRAEALIPPVGSAPDPVPGFRLEQFARALVHEIREPTPGRLQAGFDLITEGLSQSDLVLRRALYAQCLVHLHFTGIPREQAERAAALMPPLLRQEWQELHQTLDALDAHLQDAGKNDHGTKI